jgi:hypothetical protein
MNRLFLAFVHILDTSFSFAFSFAFSLLSHQKVKREGVEEEDKLQEELTFISCIYFGELKLFILSYNIYILYISWRL